jgi:beta-phosphoglucomutase-like phosphatase (HAD superfamily)
MDSALANPNVKVGICTAATKGGFEALSKAVIGTKRLKALDVLLVGDDVKNKKPDPAIYLLASERVGVPVTRCVVIEDSGVGVRAAVAAGMKCLVTPTSSTASVDFKGLGAVQILQTLKNTNVDDVINIAKSG